MVKINNKEAIKKINKIFNEKLKISLEAKEII